MMKPFDPAVFIRTLDSHPEVFICGPARGSTTENPETHLRVYANGGRLCEIPTTPDSDLKLHAFEKYLPPETQEAVKEEAVKEGLGLAFLDIKSRTREAVKLRNEKRAAFLMNETWLRLLFKAAEEKFSQNKSSEESRSSKERRNQTAIARSHRDFQAHKRAVTVCGQSAPREYLTVVCDFEMTIPESWSLRGASLLEFQDETAKRPKCDLVAFSCTQNVSDPWLISIIELKCNKRACRDKKSGLAAHARHMAVCMAETGNVPNRTDYILEILRRLSYMLQYGLLENVPEGLKDEVDRLLPGCWKDPEQIRQSREKIRGRVSLRSCFLFTGDDGIREKQDAAALCRKAEYLQDHPEEFSYQFRKDPSAVDLSDMESWSSFANSST